MTLPPMSSRSELRFQGAACACVCWFCGVGLIIAASGGRTELAIVLFVGLIFLAERMGSLRVGFVRKKGDERESVHVANGRAAPEAIKPSGSPLSVAGCVFFRTSD